MRGLLVIGHGSRRAEANATVHELARALAAAPPAGREWQAVEPAFLEIVEPSIGAGYAALARAGCEQIVVHPFFLFAGNHTSRDIPDALAEAQRRHPGTHWSVTRPLGLHPGVVDAARDRVIETLQRAPAATPPIEVT